MSDPRRFLALIILDGLAHNPSPHGNAVFHARTPTLDRLITGWPTTELVTCGPRVGLPEGQMGNSEVGHLNIGGGRIVKQELTRINEAIATNTLNHLPTLAKLFAHFSRDPERALHLIGLASTGGVHSSLDHLEALIAEALNQGVRKVYIHAITDGRDRPPTAAIDDLGRLEAFLSEKRRQLPPGQTVRIASVIGRYFAMDRDKRWERTKKGYELFTTGRGGVSVDAVAAVRAAHSAEITDEFIEPVAISGDDRAVIKDGDGILFFNFRADRMRQIVSAFTGAADFQGFDRAAVRNGLVICTLTEYDSKLPVDVLFQPTVVKNHLGEVVSGAGLRQLRIAETEKYAHVTYFFNGGVERPGEREERILIPSPRDVPTYDLKPEMSAEEVTARVLEQLELKSHDFLVLNFANCDMVGHTGSFPAAVRAVETVDRCLGRILQPIERSGGRAIVTADHGNADQMVDYRTGEPHTFHTLHPVWCSLFGHGVESLELRTGGALCDIAPTACELLGIPVPAEMTGRSLLAR